MPDKGVEEVINFHASCHKNIFPFPSKQFIIIFYIICSLSCKCNWLTFSKIDLFDQVDLMCPSLKVAVHLIDGYSRTKDQMNENIFRRKWKGKNLADLKRSLDDGSFCDPQHSDTGKKISQSRVRNIYQLPGILGPVNEH